MKSTAINHLDLFSGIGGFSLGLHRAGFNTVAFCEIEDSPRKALVKHWKDVPIYRDVREVTDERLKADGIPDISIISGGVPCQDISVGGKGAGIHGEKSGLWFNYLDCINSIRPRYAILENVSALLSRGLSEVLGSLAEIGYDATWTVYDSKYFGTPQRRRRVYVLAVRDGIPREADIFGLAERSAGECVSKVGDLNKSRTWDFKKGKEGRRSFAYFTRQRADEYVCAGISSTLSKRDYKQFTDLVLQDGTIRRVTPEERMLLQGFPVDFLDDTGMSDAEKFRCSGMSVDVVAHIGRQIRMFHDTQKV
jgi:DNA-cytosine methyltransferase